MESIKESLKILAGVEHHRQALDTFARDKYDEKFADMKRQEGTYQVYSDFEIISETQIQVNYTWGAGDMDFNSSFIVEID